MVPPPPQYTLNPYAPALTEPKQVHALWRPLALCDEVGQDANEEVNSWSWVQERR